MQWSLGQVGPSGCSGETVPGVPRDRRTETVAVLAAIDSLPTPESGAAFERWLVSLFQELGHSVDHVGGTRDQGADLLVEGAGSRTVVQAKHSATSKIGPRAVQEAHAARSCYATDAAIVVSNQEFTEQAIAVARKCDVFLWGREQLHSLLLQMPTIPSVPGSPPLRSPVLPPRWITMAVANERTLAGLVRSWRRRSWTRGLRPARAAAARRAALTAFLLCLRMAGPWAFLVGILAALVGGNLIGVLRGPSASASAWHMLATSLAILAGFVATGSVLTLVAGVALIAADVHLVGQLPGGVRGVATLLPA